MKIEGKIIAHRGVHDNVTIPENSLKAFERSLDLNYPIELDVQLTKDNVLIVFHDFTLTRMTKQTGYVQDMKYDDLKDLKLLDTMEKIPTFREVLSIIKGKVLLDIEIKNTNRVKETCDILLKELEGYNNFIIKSFNPKIVKYIKKSRPNVEVGLLITDKTNNFIYDRLLTSNLVFKYVKPDFIAISKDLISNKKFSKLDIPILIWTITNKEEITNNNLIYICNNLPF